MRDMNMIRGIVGDEPEAQSDEKRGKRSWKTKAKPRGHGGEVLRNERIGRKVWV